jgi:hypothetical protein
LLFLLLKTLPEWLNLFAHDPSRSNQRISRFSFSN